MSTGSGIKEGSLCGIFQKMTSEETDSEVCDSVAERLPSVQEALSLVLSTANMKILHTHI